MTNNNLPPDWEKTFWWEFHQWNKEQAQMTCESGASERIEITMQEFHELYNQTSCLQNSAKKQDESPSLYREQFKTLLNWISQHLEPQVQVRVGKMDSCYLINLGLSPSETQEFLENIRTIIHHSLFIMHVSDEGGGEVISIIQYLINQPIIQSTFQKIQVDKVDKPEIWLTYITIWSFIAFLKHLGRGHEIIDSSELTISELNERMSHQAHIDFPAFAKGCLSPLFDHPQQNKASEQTLENRFYQTVSDLKQKIAEIINTAHPPEKNES